MAYILGNITLPIPKSFTREFVETSQQNITIEGKSTKRVVNRKEQFTLSYQNLTTAESNSIFSEFDLEMVRSFEVTEDNLSIGPTDVLVDIKTREYPDTGKAYREDLKLILTEVK